MIKTLFVIAFLICLNSPAYAYIDPGTGSFILQGFIATFLSVVFAIKTYWQRVKAFVIAKISSKQNNVATTLKSDEIHENN